MGPLLADLRLVPVECVVGFKGNLELRDLLLTGADMVVLLFEASALVRGSVLLLLLLVGIHLRKRLVVFFELLLLLELVVRPTHRLHGLVL